ncbi:hypothetical protein D0S48_01060 [Psychrobacillus sp. AK 1817]|nr:hypothetical protein D0S48_01060 [Psychrobacillus sp. AK 1817]
MNGKPPKGKAIYGKLSGARTENPFYVKGVFLSFFAIKKPFSFFSLMLFLPIKRRNLNCQNS